MASSPYQNDNPPLLFKKIRSYENINIHDNNTISPFKSKLNQLQSNHHHKNTLRETTNAVFFKQNLSNNNYSYQYNQNSYPYHSNSLYLNNYTSSYGQDKFKSAQHTFSYTPKSQSNYQSFKKSNNKNLHSNLNQNTSDHCITNFFKKSDSKYQSIYQNNGINIDIKSGKYIYKNQQKENINNLANSLNLKNQSNKQLKNDNTSIEKDRLNKINSNSKRNLLSKSSYKAPYFDKFKEKNNYDDYDYQNMYSNKREKFYSKFQKYQNHNYPLSKPPLYNRNTTNTNLQKNLSTNLSTNLSSNLSKNLYQSTNLQKKNSSKRDSGNQIYLRQTISTFNYASNQLKNNKDQSRNNSKKKLFRTFKDKQQYSQTAPSLFFSKGASSQRSSKCHSRCISNFQSKFNNNLDIYKKQEEVKPNLNKSTQQIDNIHSNKSFLKKQLTESSQNQFSSWFQKKYSKQSEQRKKSEGSKSKRGQPCLQDFILLECKGQGRFGKVFPAQHKQTGLICAIKQVKKEALKYIQDQFIQEVKLQRYLNHPNLVKLYGVFSDKEHIYLIMEYMEGGSLYSLIKKQKKISETQAAIKLLQIAHGLQFMHSQSIVHRDIKPQNIVMTHDVCKICDFGWAAFCSGRRNTYCGTLDYVSPEVLSGSQYDSGVDIWCFGVLAYQMMVGKAPFYNISRKQTMNKIQNCDMNCPQDLSFQARSFIQNILQKNPGRRLNIEQILSDKFFFKAKQN